MENNIHTHGEVVFSAIATLSACWFPSLFCLLSLNEYGVRVEGRNLIPTELRSYTWSILTFSKLNASHLNPNQGRMLRSQSSFRQNEVTQHTGNVGKYYTDYLRRQKEESKLGSCSNNVKVVVLSDLFIKRKSVEDLLPLKGYTPHPPKSALVSFEGNKINQPKISRST